MPASQDPGRERLERHRGAQRDTRPAWMTQGLGVGVEMFGEHNDELVKPGLTRARLEEIESRKGKPLEGPDPFGEVFEEAGVKLSLSHEREAPSKRIASSSRDTTHQTVSADSIATGEETNEAVFSYEGEVTFDGTIGTVIDIPYSAVQNPVGSFSVDFCAQLAPGGSGYRSPISSRDFPPPRGYCFFVNPQGRWAFWIGVPEAQAWLKVDGPQACEDTWQRITGTYNEQDRSISLFVDDTPYGPKSALTLEPPMLRKVFEPNQRRPLRIGGGCTEGELAQAKFAFPGRVRDVHVYAKALNRPLPRLQPKCDSEPKKQRLN